VRRKDIKRLRKGEPEGREVTFVWKNHLMGNNLDPGVVHVQPPGNLAVGDNEDLPHPRGVLFNRSEGIQQLPIVW